MHRHRGGGPPRGPERRARVLWQQPEELQQGKEALAGLTYAWPGPGWWWRGAPAGRASFAAFDATPVPATLASASSGRPRARSRPSGCGVPPGSTTSPGPPGDPGWLRRGPRPQAARPRARPTAGPDRGPRRSRGVDLCLQLDWLECCPEGEKTGGEGGASHVGVIHVGVTLPGAPLRQRPLHQRHPPRQDHIRLTGVDLCPGGLAGVLSGG